MIVQPQVTLSSSILTLLTSLLLSPGRNETFHMLILPRRKGHSYYPCKQFLFLFPKLPAVADIQVAHREGSHVSPRGRDCPAYVLRLKLSQLFHVVRKGLIQDNKQMPHYETPALYIGKNSNLGNKLISRERRIELCPLIPEPKEVLELSYQTRLFLPLPRASDSPMVSAPSRTAQSLCHRSQQWHWVRQVSHADSTVVNTEHLSTNSSGAGARNDCSSAYK